MKIDALTQEQLIIIATRRPHWTADNCPKWMADNRPEWMAYNRPEWMADIPENILKLLSI